MKIKIFRSSLDELGTLEEEINRWIELNSNVRIERREHSVFDSRTTSKTEVIIVLWYFD